MLGRLLGRGTTGRADPRRNLGCAELEVDKWEVSRFVLERLVPVVGVHPYPLDELCLMVAAVVHSRPSHVFEWGTSVGASARAFHETAEAYGIDAAIHSIDLPDDVPHEEHPGTRRGRLVRAIDRVTLHQGDGLEVALRLHAEARPTKALFFLDGDHARGSVERELNGIADAAPDADVLVHDTFFQSPRSGYNVGPHEAIEAVYPRLAATHGRVGAGPGLPGMTLLYWRRRGA